MCASAPHETDQSVQSLDALIGTDRKWGVSTLQNGPSPEWNWGHLRGTVRGRRPAQRSPKAQHIQIAIAAQYCSAS
jgi:hypothetical protein